MKLQHQFFAALLCLPVAMGFAACSQSGELTIDAPADSSVALGAVARDSESYLLLTGNDAKTIHVFSVRDGSGQSARFASSVTGPYYSDGFGWQYEGAPDPLQVSFVFHCGVSGIDSPDLGYSATTTSQTPLSLEASPNEFKFNVSFTSGYVEDPIIVVKPIETE